MPELGFGGAGTVTPGFIGFGMGLRVDPAATSKITLEMTTNTTCVHRLTQPVRRNSVAICWTDKDGAEDADLLLIDLITSLSPKVSWETHLIILALPVPNPPGISQES